MEVENFFSKGNIQFGLNSNNLLYAHLLVNAGETVYCKYIKLEVGNKATNFIPRTYDEELLLCQRYFRRFKRTNTSLSNSGMYAVVNAAGTYAYAGTSFSQMRLMPTVTGSGQMRFYDGQNVAVCNVTIGNQSLVAYDGNNVNIPIQITSTVSGTIVPSTIYAVGFQDDNTYIDFDSEIY